MTVQEMRKLAIQRGGENFEGKSTGHAIWWQWLKTEGNKVLDYVDPNSVPNIDDVAILSSRVEHALKSALNRLEPPITTISMGNGLIAVL